VIDGLLVHTVTLSSNRRIDMPCDEKDLSRSPIRGPLGMYPCITSVFHILAATLAPCFRTRSHLELTTSVAHVCERQDQETLNHGKPWSRRARAYVVLRTYMHMKTFQPKTKDRHAQARNECQQQLVQPQPTCPGTRNDHLGTHAHVIREVSHADLLSVSSMPQHDGPRLNHCFTSHCAR
jgi:hypothetical protein